jgi:hypothetical protein
MLGNLIITGTLGAGKTLVSVGMAKEYLDAGLPVATNLDLNLSALLPRLDKSARVIRLPDKPTIRDLEILGASATDRNPKNFGLLLLDELGTWFNSRAHRDDDRQQVINWLLHSRKLQWNLLLIVQNIELIDKQARLTLNELHGHCMRTDRIPLPLIGWLFRLFTGSALKLPQVHMCNIFYGEGHGKIKVQSKFYRGKDLYNAYDTNQIFRDDYEHGTYCLLPPGYRSYKSAVKNWGYYMRLTKILWRKYERPVVLLASIFISLFVSIGVFYVLGKSAETLPESTSITAGSESPEPVNVTESEKKEEIKYIPTSLDYITEYQQGRVIYRFAYEGQLFLQRDLPFPVYWNGRKPFYYAPETLSSSKKTL